MTKSKIDLNKLIRFSFLTPNGIKKNEDQTPAIEVGILPNGLLKTKVQERDLIVVIDNKSNDLKLAVVQHSKNITAYPEKIENKVIYKPDNNDSLMKAVRRIALADGRLKPFTGENIWKDLNPFSSILWSLLS